MHRQCEKFYIVSISQLTMYVTLDRSGYDKGQMFNDPAVMID